MGSSQGHIKIWPLNEALVAAVLLHFPQI